MTTESSSQLLDQLRDIIPHGYFVVPGMDYYEASIRRWSATSVIEAALVFKPMQAWEISSVVQYASEHNIPFAVRCGGHSCKAASSSPGIVIDLSRMRDVSVDRAGMTVTFGGGCLGAHVDKVLESHGLATTTATVSHVGIGGFILGGGISMLTPLHGMAVDNLLSAQVVFANGSVVEASSDEYGDLFWAIRGAGALFGVVTRFTMRVYDQGPVWSGVLTFGQEKLPGLIAAANRFQEQEDFKGHCFQIAIGHDETGTGRLIRVIPFYQGPEEKARLYFSEVLKLGPTIDTTTMMTIADVNTLFGPLVKHGVRRSTGSGSMVTPLEISSVQKVARKYWDFFDAHPRAASISVLILRFASQHKVLKVSQTATAFSNRGNIHETVSSLGWHEADFDNQMASFNRSICQDINETLGFSRCEEMEGGRPVGRYINFDSASFDPEDAFGVNLPRIRTLKEKYDPRNLFNRWHSLSYGTGYNNSRL